MKVTVYLNGIFISTKRTSGVDKDNRPVTNDYIALESNGEVGNLRCLSSLSDIIQQEKKYSEMVFQGVVDTWNKDILITGYKLKESKDEKETSGTAGSINTSK